MILMDIKKHLNESLDSDASGDAYYIVNEATLKLQEVKPYIEEDSKQEALYNKIIIDLNELQVSFTENSVNESADPKVVEQLRKSKYYSGESLVQNYIRLQNQKDELEKQGKLTDRLRYEIDSRIGDLLLKSESTGQKVKKEPKVKHDDDYCNQAAADFVGDKMSDEFGTNWRDLPKDEIIGAVRKYTNEYGEANAQPEYANEDFYGDEADYNKVYNILINRNTN